MQIEVAGVADVYDGDVLIQDKSVFKKLNGYCYKGEKFTDYLDGPENESVAKALKSSGYLKFELHDKASAMRVVTVYKSKRTLTPKELKQLLKYTVGQWSDGIGENVASESAYVLGYSLQCRTRDPKPTITQIDD